MINFNERLKNIKTAAITGHVRPDGDCVGSTLGFYNYMAENFPQIDVDLYLEQPGEEFSYLQNMDKIQTRLPDTDKKYDLFVVFDCGDEGRFEPFAKLLTMADYTICIDHHMENSGFADESFVIPDLSSTCELLYECLSDDMISKAVAECLYTGIVCDTGIFKYQSTTSKTMAIAGKLMDKGINHTRIIDEGFYTKTYHQNQIIGRAMLESVLFYGGKCIYSAASMEIMKFYELDGKQMGGVIDQLRNTQGVEVAIFMYELKKGEYKVSMRARDYIDVSRVCRVFGGGGHVKAAGCTMQGTVHDIVNNIGAQLEIQFREHGVN
ncbi:MAG: bifunctional oligoribonuclease/PAP phosphatase NrnA [Thermoflexaceae bacterium]|nr:bifunctional oligoribonuclease/PAP phosphatase NrnA [Thermoflexaceae bacterium]